VNKGVVMLGVEICNLPETGGSLTIVMGGLFALVAGVIAVRWVRSSAHRVSVMVAPLVLLGGLTLVPAADTGCLNPASDAPALAVVEGLPAAPTPLLSNAAVATGGAVTVTIGGFAPNELVQLIVASTPQVIGFATANAQGVVTLSGNLPEGLASGEHTLAVYAPVSGIGFSQPITVATTNTTTTLAPTTTVAPTTTSTSTTSTTTTVVASCATGAECAVGDIGPGGGIVFYDAGSVQQWGQYLEAACVGWSDGVCGGRDTADPGVVWGCSGTEIDGADGNAIGKGETNTAEIIVGCPTMGIAARLASDLVLGGQSDWFLPSIPELNVLFDNQARVGGFTDNYWSSTETGASQADYKYFGGGAVNGAPKTDAGIRVRPIRAF
jgi:hypothetical protein